MTKCLHLEYSNWMENYTSVGSKTASFLVYSILIWIGKGNHFEKPSQLALEIGLFINQVHN